VNAIRLVQTVWAVILLAVAGLFVSTAQNWVRITSVVLAAIYLLACLGTWRDSRLAWRLAVLEPVLVSAWCVWWLTWALFEVIEYRAKGYNLNPIVLLAVIYTMPLLLPQLAVIALMWHHRTEVLARVRL
jgi:hypothetical protein